MLSAERAKKLIEDLKEKEISLGSLIKTRGIFHWQLCKQQLLIKQGDKTSKRIICLSYAIWQHTFGFLRLGFGLL